MTDITEHPTGEGKLYCAAVMDAYSRRIIGWSIDARQDTDLVAGALAMVVTRRNPPTGSTILHSDHGTQGGFNWSSQHLVAGDGAGGFGEASGG
ncbi:DDE-type integrase/transposase/recombinase, partial [Actinomadura sp. CNU-125]|uniref:DDE-type integrase/transposase/recombinase n=1 Tax=Actinomadura sp. CNU-125 TaxID=1904961 RepID=UPI001177414C